MKHEEVSRFIRLIPHYTINLWRVLMHLTCDINRSLLKLEISSWIPQVHAHTQGKHVSQNKIQDYINGTLKLSTCFNNNNVKIERKVSETNYAIIDRDNSLGISKLSQMSLDMPRCQNFIWRQTTAALIETVQVFECNINLFSQWNCQNSDDKLRYFSTKI